MKPYFRILATLMLAACGSTQGNVLGEGPAPSANPPGTPPPATPPGTPPGTPPPPPPVANLDPKPCPGGDNNVTAIAGTWDIIDSQDGTKQGASVLTIDASTFSFTRNVTTLSLTVSGDTLTLSYTDKTKTTPINASRTANPVDIGVIPLALGGDWTFASQTDAEQCTASFGAAGFNATCNHVNGTPAGTLDGTMVGQRVATAPSVFGQLGGDWTFQSGSGAANVSFKGNLFTATTTKLGRIPSGTMAVRVCTGTVSGVTPQGFEIAGVKQ